MHGETLYQKNPKLFFTVQGKISPLLHNTFDKMVRQFKHHEGKLLKKVDFVNWKTDNGHREQQVMGTFHLQDRDDYNKYNKICGKIRQLAYKLSQLQPDDPVRIKHEKLLLDKLYQMGILSTNTTVSHLETKVSVSAIAKRRLPVIMHKLKMTQKLDAGTAMIEQGHVRVGPHIVTDPAFLVTRNMEDFVTWTDRSKIKKATLKYRNELDDFNTM
jgi:U3 small nucleolar ribonucleoprotein protein IMP3